MFLPQLLLVGRSKWAWRNTYRAQQRISTQFRTYSTDWIVFKELCVKFSKYYSETQKFKTNRANSGCKGKTTLIQVRMLKRLVRKGRFMSLSFISRKWREQGLADTTPTTRRRVLKHDFQSREPGTKPLVIFKQKGARFHWGKERL